MHHEFQAAPGGRGEQQALQLGAHALGGNLGYAPRTLAERLTGASYAELEEFALDVRRRAILEMPGADMRRIAKERLEHWQGLVRS